MLSVGEAPCRRTYNRIAALGPGINSSVDVLRASGTRHRFIERGSAWAKYKGSTGFDHDRDSITTGMDGASRSALVCAGRGHGAGDVRWGRLSAANRSGPQSGLYPRNELGRCARDVSPPAGGSRRRTPPSSGLGGVFVLLRRGGARSAAAEEEARPRGRERHGRVASAEVGEAWLFGNVKRISTSSPAAGARGLAGAAAGVAITRDRPRPGAAQR